MSNLSQDDPDLLEQQEDEEQSRREAYEDWMEQKRDMAKDDTVLMPYEPRDREEYINKYEI